MHDLAITPDGAGLADVPALGDVDAREVAEPLAVLWVLPDRHVDPVLVEDGRGDDFAGPVGSGVLEALAVLLPVLGRVAVVPPQLLEGPDTILFLGRRRIEAVAETVARAEDDLLLAADFAESW